MTDDQPIPSDLFSQDVLPPLPDSSDMKAYKRAWRARRKALGVCTTCGGARDVEGGVRCSACLAKDNDDYQRLGKARYQRRAREVNGRDADQRRAWTAAGLCSWCGAERGNPRIRRCASCAVYARNFQRQRDRKNRDRGLCRCGKPRAGNCRKCSDCLTASRLEYQRLKERDPLRLLIKMHRRRARKAGNGGSFTALEWLAILRLCDHTCLMCRKKEPEIKLTVDHVVPVNQGGPSWAWNIQPLCDSCNKSKGDTFLDLRPNGPWLMPL